VDQALLKPSSLVEGSSFASGGEALNSALLRVFQSNMDNITGTIKLKASAQPVGCINKLPGIGGATKKRKGKALAAVLDNDGFEAAQRSFGVMVALHPARLLFDTLQVRSFLGCKTVLSNQLICSSPSYRIMSAIKLISFLT
jgi:hypothetical protein